MGRCEADLKGLAVGAKRRQEAPGRQQRERHGGLGARGIQLQEVSGGNSGSHASTHGRRMPATVIELRM